MMIEEEGKEIAKPILKTINEKITYQNATTRLPLFHIPTMYLQSVTMQTLHDKENEKTTLIPSIDTNLLEAVGVTCHV